jgi:catechol 2,3-dioxygenase-like lactoylglutathione lyase family enzyme
MRPVMTHVALQVRDLDASIAFYRDYCGLTLVRDRTKETSDRRIVWLAEPGRETELIFVLFPGSAPLRQPDGDYGHFGFALASREEVDAVAERARREGLLAWGPHEEPFPVGYYCGVRDPDGRCVEFSYGQPLGPGAGAQ